MNKSYTIEEIRYYLEGCLLCGNLNGWNKMLSVAINELEDPEDGIEAVLERHVGMPDTGKSELE